jgi:ATP-dependent DNA helicase RecG
MTAKTSSLKWPTSLDEVLGPDKSKVLEFKRLGTGKVAKMLETLCAFANTEGGFLVVGVGDKKDVKPGEPIKQRLWGVQENIEAFDEFQRKCRTHFNPPLIQLIEFREMPCTLRDERPGRVMMVRVCKSDQVHSVVDGGTWSRLNASNRQLGPQEITNLSYRRGERSAESECVAIPLALLETATWRSFLSSRSMRSGSMVEQLQRIGLAEVVKTAAGDEIQPRRAAVLLFAEEPGSLLAAFGSRADIRLMVYSGKEVGTSATPNWRKPPKTIRGPLIEQIDMAVRAVLDELAHGVTLSSSGFKTRHKYPERVVKEAIVNAVIHRDYRLNRDIVIRIFEDRISVESPGALPGTITTANIKQAGSKARNPLVAQNLREFSEPPNIDAGEGVPMMFGEMAAARLYPPQYQQTLDTAVEILSVTLFNEERPPAWEQVSDWIDRNGPIANAKVCEIAGLDTLKASKLLKTWVDYHWLEPMPGRGRRNAAYRKSLEVDLSAFEVIHEKDV